MKYSELFAQYSNSLKSLGLTVDRFTEFKFEALWDFSPEGALEAITEWYRNHVENSTMSARLIPLSECRQWHFDSDSGSFCHDSGEFFRVEAYRISGTGSREVDSGWDQPFLTQVGNDGGILGLLRKRFDGIPYYLIEAKEEPGNYNIVQISPTVQATYSNLKRAHKGKQTHYSDLFLNPQEHPVSVLFDQWTSEDGGRLFNKRNRSMLLEYDESVELELVSNRFRWVTLYQLKQLIRDGDAMVAPHIRGILSAL